MLSDTNENKVTALLEFTSDYDVGCHNDFYVMQILSCLYSLVVNVCEWGKRKQKQQVYSVCYYFYIPSHFKDIKIINRKE